MKTLFVALISALVVGATLLPDSAEARRFGGGKSLGKQYTMPRQAQPQTAPRQADQSSGRQASTTPGQARPQSGASRWLGPLAGLAAGGLLASLLFGDAFEGLQIMDFLLIAALIFGGVMLFKMLRSRGPAPAAVASGGYGAPHVGAATERPYGGAPAEAGGTPPTPSDVAAADAPAWLDTAGFVEGAKTHFVRLQAAWDQSDFRDIREYTTPQLFAEIRRERESLGDAPSFTEVVTLNADLLSVQRDRDQVVASVRFTGLIREEESGVAQPLDEVWHVSHDWDSPDGDWLISGIQQTS
jgi:predicted lipid-binding transport protein (Tim44 family)